MTNDNASRLRALEGHHVSVALRDGSRIDDSQLVSAGHRSVWLFSNRADVFVPLVDVVDVWEVVSGIGFRAA
jgi:hypothetical protein